METHFFPALTNVQVLFSADRRAHRMGESAAPAIAAAIAGRAPRPNLAPVVVVDAVVVVCRRRRPLFIILRDGGHQLGRVLPSVVLLQHVEPEAR